ncbi:hypothetical protein TUZN_1041 [Thermoproteus uzoniensis 768-20]|uniref:Uncharacterized protein n=1 Tax=Thermoproteus uzoniensis (strain 768-20) TaxID=999630 RepID=F2L6C6_THEU7|nr:hypothetical protein TUZN_1041 [Thermoproteus uzoniensis 768-20]
MPSKNVGPSPVSARVTEVAQVRAAGFREGFNPGAEVPTWRGFPNSPRCCRRCRSWRLCRTGSAPCAEAGGAAGGCGLGGSSAGYSAYS